MPTVRVTATLPYCLLVPEGQYRFSQSAEGGLSLGRAIRDTKEPKGLGEERTTVSSVFQAPENPTDLEVQKISAREAMRLLSRTNRLLRWYRLLANRPDVLEVTRAQVSPFRFGLEGPTNGKAPPWGAGRIEYEPEGISAPDEANVHELGARLRDRLAEGSEPAIAELNLVDAQHACNTGRFREAVLLSWSVIDSSFVSTFNGLVDARLAGEWGDTRDFLKGLDFGLRHKMTSGLRLVAGKSLFDASPLWEALSSSYAKRNRIIHQGSAANEDDAAEALDVARRVLVFVGTL